jgi:hypothetical protein
MPWWRNDNFCTGKRSGVFFWEIENGRLLLRCGSECWRLWKGIDDVAMTWKETRKMF